MADPKWFTAAEADLGLAELPGPAANARIVQMYEDAGHPEVKDDAVAWCSAAMNSWMKAGGVVGTGALTARSWMKWGKPVDWRKPMPRGTVVVFPRGNSKWQGHVAMVYEDTGGGTFKVIGGNQGDKVSIVSYPRSKVIAARWPNTAGNSGTMRGGAVGLIGAVGSEGIDQITPLLTEIQGYAEQIQPYISAAKWVLLTISVVSLCWTLWHYYQTRLKPQPEPEIPEDV
jgi:uncharacterized protein (TIGR02594 family)